MEDFKERVASEELLMGSKRGCVPDFMEDATVHKFHSILPEESEDLPTGVTTDDEVPPKEIHEDVPEVDAGREPVYHLLESSLELPEEPKPAKPGRRKKAVREDPKPPPEHIEPESPEAQAESEHPVSEVDPEEDEFEKQESIETSPRRGRKPGSKNRVKSGNSVWSWKDVKWN